MRNLTVALIQTELSWESPAENRQHFGQLLESSSRALDLVVLPEMFNSGFSMNAAEHAETMEGPTVEWMLQMARSSQAAVCGSLAVADQGAVFNRLVFARPDGSLCHYDKRHLFRMADEQERYAAGDSRLLVEWRGWRICPMVCYDLRFPVWSRNRNDYDLLLYVANWPQQRSLHWRQLLIARAIENLSVVIGVNRVGIDGNDISYSGDSLVVDATGRLQLDAKNRTGLQICELELHALRDYRERFPAHLDSDRFTIET